MRVPIPHNLDKDTVRERMRTRSHKIADNIPGGMADVQTSWPTEDRMAMVINAMGQVVRGHVDIEDNQVVFQVDLPPALSFVEPMLRGAIEQQGQKLITKS
ncbi:MAG: hypothetical protein DI636_06210 [Pelagerythrobacter marensis]|uniref:polyhydroxyalkanoic acid system family protein n=1 Tax=Qipengyuania sp. YIM B01966 TaxID=2778646 RepID=UPI000DB774CA|nr:polyhydroxyalkanoic acid system family protein [Qipengyuania sp. YIM B01966]PZO70074.1 MAG: hypothetical protein DI636_06210 [Pelagerythrobacter marensis]PZU15885.1 MAG: hypothetical protein DI591_07800 [Citromicrobium sp.]